MKRKGKGKNDAMWERKRTAATRVAANERLEGAFGTVPCKECRSVAHHVLVVLLYRGISEYHVAVTVATAATALDVI